MGLASNFAFLGSCHNEPPKPETYQHLWPAYVSLKIAELEQALANPNASDEYLAALIAECEQLVARVKERIGAE